MRKTCVFLFVNSVFIFQIANTFVASHAMKYSENVFVIRKFLAYTSPPPPPQLYMLATALKLESGIHYSFRIRNPRCGIRNPRSRIRNPSSGIRNPNTSWITSHGAKCWCICMHQAHTPTGVSLAFVINETCKMSQPRQYFSE